MSNQASSGVDIRAQIGTENVKALLLINSGGILALLTLFSSVLGKEEGGVIDVDILSFFDNTNQ